MRWRQEHKVEELANWEAPAFIDQEFTIKAPGFDKQGCIGTNELCGH